MNFSNIAARPTITRTDLNGIDFENLAGTAAHEGVSPDAEWFGGESAPGGSYRPEADGKTRVYLYRRAQREPVATLGSWSSQVTWNKVAHVNAAFSGDGNRFYLLRGPQDQDSEDESSFTLHYVNLESYKKTISRYCAAGVPYFTHDPLTDDRYITFISVTHSDGVTPEGLITKIIQDEFPEHGYQYLDYPLDGRNAVTPGDTVTISISANENSTSSVIKGYVDWNQSFTFDDSGENVFTQGTADQVNPGNSSFTQSFTVPQNALAGDTLMRIRFNEISWEDPGPCGSRRKTTTYDLPIKVAFTGSNACVDADQIEANGDINGDINDAKDQWLGVEVTSQVNAILEADGDILSLLLTSPHERKDGVWYHSSDASDPKNRPQLTYVKGVM